MNLSKKVFLVIAPVVTLFFVAAASIAYQQQKAQIIKLENSRLQLALSDLSIRYNQYSSFSEGYLNTIIQSNSLRHYLRESSNTFRRIALVRNIESYLRDFENRKSNMLSLSISRSNPEKKIIEYIELSEDPFSTIPNALKAHSFSIFENSGKIDPVLIKNDDNYLLALSALIDPDTLERPLATRKDQAYSITFAIEPSDFTEKITQYENDFNIEIDIVDAYSPSSSDSAIIVNLDEQRYLVARLSPQSISNQLQPIWIKLSVLSILLMLSCAIVIFLLVSHLVISPITRLESRVKNVNFENSESFNTHDFNNDEVGNLALEFKKMYKSLSQEYKKTRQLLRTDHLTKQANLYEIKAKFIAQIAKARSSQASLVFLYIDLDNFKFVNDRYGHDIGDKVLVAFSENIVKLLNTYLPSSEKDPQKWIFGRIAGDEFGVILTNSPSSELVETITSSILNLFSGGFKFHTGKYPISASIGVVCYPRDGDTPSQLISSADKAMYQSKHLGKNCVSYYSEKMAYKIRRNREIESELKSSNFDEEFYLVFLPIIQTDSLEIYGFELLLRWNSPRLGFISPAEFIPIAEACGYFELIDSWVIEKGFAIYSDIKNILGTDYTLSINLSSAQITLNKIHEEILNLSDRFNIPRKQIQFEMTETTGAEYAQGLDNLLKSITESGFRLAIDDFGSGYTSLQQLVEYPATTIKFDKSFLDATMRGGGRKILKPLVEMCHAQKMSVTVEGIETLEQYNYMCSIGVDHLQGFLFCQPVRIEELPNALAKLQETRTNERKRHI